MELGDVQQDVLRSDQGSKLTAYFHSFLAQTTDEQKWPPVFAPSPLYHKCGGNLIQRESILLGTAELVRPGT